MEKIISKISQRTGLLWRIRKCIDIELAKHLYQSLIGPHYIYCCFVYDGCGLELKQLQISQHKALRAVLRVPNDYPSELLHTNTNFDWLGIARAKSSCIELFKLLKGHGPKSLSDDVITYKTSLHIKVHWRTEPKEM